MPETFDGASVRTWDVVPNGKSIAQVFGQEVSKRFHKRGKPRKWYRDVGDTAQTYSSPPSPPLTHVASK